MLWINKHNVVQQIFRAYPPCIAGKLPSNILDWMSSTASLCGRGGPLSIVSFRGGHRAQARPIRTLSVPGRSRYGSDLTKLFSQEGRTPDFCWELLDERGSESMKLEDSQSSLVPPRRGKPQRKKALLGDGASPDPHDLARAPGSARVEISDRHSLFFFVSPDSTPDAPG